MLTKKEIYLKAFKELEKLRLKSEVLRKNNIKTAIKVCPEIENLTNSLKKTSIKLLKSIINRDKVTDNVIEELYSENKKIRGKIKILLEKNNLPPNLMENKYFCKKCKDYGVLNNEKCECLKNLIKTIMASELKKSANFKLTSFEEFNLNFYSKRVEPGEKISAYEHMALVLKVCEEFANNFPKFSKGLVMCGLTGLGKTHLSLAVASKVISKGFTVIYETASEMTRKMASKYFNKETTQEYDFLTLIKETDLLILDDLGAEFESNFNKAAIFEIVNIRTSLELPLIINTNLTPKELENIYGARVVSRVFSYLNMINFVGNDNRQNLGDFNRKT